MINKFCEVCNTTLDGKKKKYCSVKCKHRSTNIIHQNYACQAKRGLERRTKLLAMLGGKCTQCGYNKNHTALCFHHINVETKLFALTLRECANNNFSLLEEEAKKCILLCANCHMEEHYRQFTT